MNHIINIYIRAPKISYIYIYTNNFIKIEKNMIYDK